MDIQNVSWERFDEIIRSADQILVTSDTFRSGEEEYLFWTFLEEFSDPSEIQFIQTSDDEFFVVSKQEIVYDGCHYICKCGDSVFKIKANKVTTTPILP
jgi:hypothetical protein